MSQVAEKFFDPQQALDELRDSGLINQFVYNSLQIALNSSATGRNFGHPSSTALPQALSKLAQLSQQNSELTEERKEEIRSTFNIKLKNNRSRKLTPLNSLLQSIANDIEKSHPDPTVSKRILCIEKKTLFTRFIQFLIR